MSARIKCGVVWVRGEGCGRGGNRKGLVQQRGKINEKYNFEHFFADFSIIQIYYEVIFKTITQSVISLPYFPY